MPDVPKDLQNLAPIVNPLLPLEAKGAQAAANDAGSLLNPLSGLSLSVSGIAGWFMRGLKMLFGGILMIIGISKLSGLDNRIVQTANRIPLVAAV